MTKQSFINRTEDIKQRLKNKPGNSQNNDCRMRINDYLHTFNSPDSPPSFSIDVPVRKTGSRTKS